MGIFDLFRKKPKYIPTEQDARWNRFIDEICSKDLDDLSEIQKNAVLCFWYDGEVQNGGHSLYFDVCEESDHSRLTKALSAVGGGEAARIFEQALSEGEKDGWSEADEAYYRLSPSLCRRLMDYVEENREEIFR